MEHSDSHAASGGDGRRAVASGGDGRRAAKTVTRATAAACVAAETVTRAAAACVAAETVTRATAAADEECTQNLLFGTTRLRFGHGAEGVGTLEARVGRGREIVFTSPEVAGFMVAYLVQTLARTADRRLLTNLLTMRGVCRTWRSAVERLLTESRCAAANPALFPCRLVPRLATACRRLAALVAPRFTYEDGIEVNRADRRNAGRTGLAITPCRSLAFTPTGLAMVEDTVRVRNSLQDPASSRARGRRVISRCPDYSWTDPATRKRRFFTVRFGEEGRFWAAMVRTCPRNGFVRREIELPPRDFEYYSRLSEATEDGGQVLLYEIVPMDSREWMCIGFPDTTIGRGLEEGCSFMFVNVETGAVAYIRDNVMPLTRYLTVAWESATELILETPLLTPPQFDDDCPCRRAQITVRGTVLPPDPRGVLATVVRLGDELWFQSVVDDHEGWAPFVDFVPLEPPDLDPVALSDRYYNGAVTCETQLLSMVAPDSDGDVFVESCLVPVRDDPRGERESRRIMIYRGTPTWHDTRGRTELRYEPVRGEHDLPLDEYEIGCTLDRLDARRVRATVTLGFEQRTTYGQPRHAVRAPTAAERMPHTGDSDVVIVDVLSTPPQILFQSDRNLHFALN